jgi:hypothetical protein
MVELSAQTKHSSNIFTPQLIINKRIDPQKSLSNLINRMECPPTYLHDDALLHNLDRYHMVHVFQMHVEWMRMRLPLVSKMLINPS